MCVRRPSRYTSNTTSLCAPAGPSKFSTRTRPRSVPLGVCSCSGGGGVASGAHGVSSSPPGRPPRLPVPALPVIPPGPACHYCVCVCRTDRARVHYYYIILLLYADAVRNAGRGGEKPGGPRECGLARVSAVAFYPGRGRRVRERVQDRAS